MNLNLLLKYSVSVLDVLLLLAPYLEVILIWGERAGKALSLI